MRAFGGCDHTKVVSCADKIHEKRIRECEARWLEGKAEWSELTALINERSPQQVARMEWERGIA